MTLLYAIAIMLFTGGMLIGIAIGFTGGRKTVRQ